MVSDQHHASAASPPQKKSYIRWTEGWVSPELFWTFWRRQASLVSAGI